MGYEKCGQGCLCQYSILQAQIMARAKLWFFFIGTEYSFIGPTPDGIVPCLCGECKARCLEIKCPFKLQDKGIAIHHQISF